MAQPNGYFRERSETSIWNSLSRLLTILIVVAGLAGIIAMILPELARQKTQQAEIDELKQRVDQQKVQLARDGRQLQWLQNNPEYVEVFARDRLDLMKEGETVFRVETEKKQ